MKITLLLFTIALLAIAAALILPALRARRKPSYRSQLRAGVRPMSRLERLIVPFLLAMSVIATRFQASFAGGNRLALANALATPAGCEDSKLADAAIGRRTVVKPGSDADHIDVCGTGDIPLGATRDGSAALGELVSFAQFGLYDKELEGTASGAITDGDMLVPGAAGTVRKLPVANGTYYIIGRAKGGAADGAPVAYIPCFPIQRVV